MKKFKKVIGLFMLCSVVFSMSNVSVFAQEKTNRTDVKQDDGISNRKIDTSGGISLGRNEYIDENFTMKGILGITTTNASPTVTYTVTIKSGMSGCEGYYTITSYIQ